MKSNNHKHVAIIGGGPTGLMAAEVLLNHGIQVDLYDAMPSVGRKFLLAGIGGLNLTHSEDTEKFLSRYTDRQSNITPWIKQFDAQKIQQWANELGIPTFIGSSGRIFPEAMKAAPLLRAWLQRLRLAGLNIHVQQRWHGFNSENSLLFDTPSGEKIVPASTILLALGGGSWPKLGSDGAWVDILTKKNIKIAPLEPANCGFNVEWSEHFKSQYAGHPLKTIAINGQQGECVITTHGIEGGLIYFFSSTLRQQIAKDGNALLNIDLLPDKSILQIETALQQPRKHYSLSNFLRKTLNLNGIKLGLIYENINQVDRNNPNRFAYLIKHLPIKLLSTRPIDEAISTAGGICFEGLDQELMFTQLPGIFCAGEMLDWEAPTGGYLLTACLASGRYAAYGIIKWLNQPQKNIL